jgi:hypothetical protein
MRAAGKPSIKTVGRVGMIGTGAPKVPGLMIKSVARAAKDAIFYSIAS